MTPEQQTARRARSRRGRGDDLRAEILAATDKLMLDTGDVQAVSIRSIADAVGVTPPSIYLHFPDKDALIYAVCGNYFDDFVSRFSPEELDDSDPVAFLRRMGLAYVSFGLERPEAYRVMFMSHEKHIPDGVDPDEFPGHVAFQLLVSTVAKGIGQGVFAPGDPVTGAVSVWCAVHGLTSLLISLPDFPWPPLELMVGEICDVQVRGLSA